MTLTISNGPKKVPERVIIYGPEGIGKSTLASQFPEPLFIDTEGSTAELDVSRFDKIPKTWSEFVQMVLYVKDHPDVCKTLVIDSLDWSERLCIRHICETNGKTSLGDFAYGTGYAKLAEEFQRMLNVLNDISAKGINIVMTAHSMIRKFERPDESGAFDRFEMKLERKTAPLVKEWSSLIVFCDYEIHVAKDSNDKVKAHGGNRVMYTSHHPCWDAKNRRGMPDKLPLSFDSLAPYILDESPKPSDTTNNEVLNIQKGRK